MRQATHYLINQEKPQEEETSGRAPEKLASMASSNLDPGPSC